MSCEWKYVPNIEREQVFCPHCSDWRYTPYFSSDERLSEWTPSIVCLRCTKVLAKAYMMLGMERRLR